MLNDKQQKLCSDSRWDFSDLNALILNCTLKPTPQQSHTEGLIRMAQVHLESPEDIASEECADTIFPVIGHRRPNATQESLAEAANMIEAAKCPLLLIGCAGL